MFKCFTYHKNAAIRFLREKLQGSFAATLKRPNIVVLPAILNRIIPLQVIKLSQYSI